MFKTLSTSESEYIPYSAGEKLKYYMYTQVL